MKVLKHSTHWSALVTRRRFLAFSPVSCLGELSGCPNFSGRRLHKSTYSPLQIFCASLAGYWEAPWGGHSRSYSLCGAPHSRRTCKSCAREIVGWVPASRAPCDRRPRHRSGGDGGWNAWQACMAQSGGRDGIHVGRGGDRCWDVTCPPYTTCCWWPRRPYWHVASHC